MYIIVDKTVHFAIPRDSLNLIVLQLREKDVLRDLENKWWYEKGQCGGNPNAVKKVNCSIQFERIARKNHLPFRNSCIFALHTVFL